MNPYLTPVPPVTAKKDFGRFWRRTMNAAAVVPVIRLNGKADKKDTKGMSETKRRAIYLIANGFSPAETCRTAKVTGATLKAWTREKKFRDAVKAERERR